MPKAYVLLSGGVDSSSVLALANIKHGGMVAAVSINYGQRHFKELEAAKDVAKHFSNQHIIKNLEGLIGVGGLTDPTLLIPKVSYEELGDGVSPTYVPFRNGLMISVMASLANADPEAEEIYYGAHAEDAENWAYPDCTPEFIEAMAQAVYIGTYHKIKLTAPFMDNTKAEVVMSGDRTGVPWHLTWSCYEGGTNHCGICPTCRARKDAFLDAGVNDPTKYDGPPLRSVHHEEPEQDNG